MDSGIWVLLGVGVGTLLNLLVWLVQFRVQRQKEERLAAGAKLEELARLLMQTDAIVKTAVTETMVAPDLVALWKNRKLWADLNLIHARIIVSIYFHDALKAFDEMQMPVLQFSEAVKELMQRGGSADRSSLGQYHDKFATARMGLLDKCLEVFKDHSIGK